MSADIVNLRRARKAVARRTRETEAATARAWHGRTLGERDAQLLETRRAERLLDGALRDGVRGDGSLRDETLHDSAASTDGRA